MTATRTAELVLPLVAVAGTVAGLIITGMAAIDFARSEVLGPWTYGFFFTTFAPFLLAIAYAVARIAALALFGPVRSRLLAILVAPFAVALAIVACTWPTFGGLIVRPGFVAGGVALLQQMDPQIGLILGAIVAGLVFALVLGLASLLVGLSASLRFGALVKAMLRGLLLTIPPLALVLAPKAGIIPGGTWPKTALGLADGAILAAMACLAFLPHALASARRTIAVPA
jgi:hypothetical protein